ncbi:MAG TPA: adenylyltransferase/cytidyltransferase family protein [Candidatus Dormibacteraeota bacterium]|nr:adenylyltransferase/cytidyltransferase family protein [Candidatus Dormibacteraeota bacterium]
MAITSGIFGDEANFSDRYITELGDLCQLVEHLKGIGLKIVLTSGSFDLIHLGHLKYLELAKNMGDVLIVGVDGDEKIRRRKGPDRPMVPQDERLETLAYQRPVDILYVKGADDERWSLISTVQPDVLVLSNDHGYKPGEMKALKKFCGEIAVMERQSTTTTSERIRQMFMHLGEKLGPQLAEILPQLIDDIARGKR